MPHHKPKPPRGTAANPALSASIDKIICLGRDNVINQAYGVPIRTVGQWKWLPGAPEAIAALQYAGWWLIICTNQPYVTLDEYYELMGWVGHDYFWMPNFNKNNHGFPHGDAVCFHRDVNCGCHIPEIGLWKHQIEPSFGRIDMPHSWFLDSRFEHLEFGRRVGLKLAWITTCEDDVREPLDYDVYGSLHHFAETLLKKKIPWTDHPQS